MSSKKLSGYDIPTTITLELPNYYDRAIFGKFSHATDIAKFNPSAAFSSMRFRLERADTMQPMFDAHIHASVLAQNVIRNYEQSAMIESEWASGENSDFDAWLKDYECDYGFVKKFIELNEDNLTERKSCSPGGGSYGADVYQFNDIVVMEDTENNAWFFPANTEYGPDVVNYEEITEDNDEDDE